MDSAGRPLEGAYVGFAIGDRRTVHARTDKDGRYTIEGPEGEGRVAVTSMDGFYAEAGHEVAVSLAPERVTTAKDLVAQRVPPIRGVVTTPDGRPVAGALVTSRDPGERSAVTKKDGSFELPLYRILDSFASVMASHPTERLSGGTTVDPEHVKSGKLVQIEVRREATLRGKLTDERGKPLAAVPVTLWGRLMHGSSSSHSRFTEAVTNDRGEFEFPGLSRHATYRVDVGDGEKPAVPRNAFRELAEDNVEMELPPLSDEEVKSLKRSMLPTKVPELSVRSWINSTPLKLDALRGKVVLVRSWATWREPHVKETAGLQLRTSCSARKGWS